MIITLNYRAPLGLPSGVTLQPGIPTPVHGWDADSKSKIVQAWVKSGILKVGQGLSKFMPDESEGVVGQDAPDSQEPEYVETHAIGDEEPVEVPANQPAADEKAELLAALEARGIKADKRTGVAKLRALLAETKL